jgi:hypothetical protein
MSLLSIPSPEKFTPSSPFRQFIKLMVLGYVIACRHPLSDIAAHHFEQVRSAALSEGSLLSYRLDDRLPIQQLYSLGFAVRLSFKVNLHTNDI